MGRESASQVNCETTSKRGTSTQYLQLRCQCTRARRRASFRSDFHDRSEDVSGAVHVLLPRADRLERRQAEIAAPEIPDRLTRRLHVPTVFWESGRSIRQSQPTV